MFINGNEYPIAATFAAVASYLEMVGQDNPEGMAAFVKLPPSRYPYLIAACVNEALKKEGREERLTVEEISDCDFMEVSTAVAVIFTEMSPKNTPPQEPKKD